MPKGMRSSGFVTVLVAGLTLLGAVPASAGILDWGDDPLPLPGFSDLAVDEGHHQVFVSGGKESNGVVVTEYDGEVVTTIEKQYGASGLALSADGSTLYVALAAGDAISAIDTETLKETARYDTGSNTCPQHLTRVGSVLWFGYGCGTAWNGKVGKLDLAADTPEPDMDLAEDLWLYGAPLVMAPSEATDTLVVGQPQLSPAGIHVFTINDQGELVPGADTEDVGSGLLDLELTADGSTLFAAVGSRSYVQGLTTGELSGQGSYHTGAVPNAAALAPDGTHLAVGRSRGGDDIFLYELGAADPEEDFALDDGRLAPRGLAWSADSEWLFAVTTSVDDGGAPTLHTLHDPIDDGWDW